MLQILCVSSAFGAEYTVNSGESIQDALDTAVAGDTIAVAPGTYVEELVTNAAGTESEPITLKAEPGAEVIITASGEVLQIDHPWFRVEGIIFDGQYGDKDTLDINDGASNLLLSGVEVRHSGRDCVDMNGPSDVRIDQALIHHCLKWDNGRADAHGIVAGNAMRLSITNTEIHTFSGDAVQLDPDRISPSWDELLIEDSLFWVAPLPEETNGFPAGSVPGENAFDSKTWDDSVDRAKVTIRGVTAHGFRGAIENQAAFNIKESVDALVEGVVVYDSEIAFRLRGPGRDIGAQVTILNTVVHDVDVAFRYEDEIDRVEILNTTIGDGVSRVFKEASSGSTVPDVRNTLFLGSELPAEAQGGSNLVTDSSSFVDMTSHDYHLVEGSPAIDGGESIAVVSVDMDGLERPQGSAHDIGAFEFPQPEDTGEPDSGEPDTGDTDSGDADTDETDTAPQDSDDNKPEEENEVKESGSSCSTGGGSPVWSLWLAVLLFLRKEKSN